MRIKKAKECRVLKRSELNNDPYGALLQIEMRTSAMKFYETDPLQTHAC